MTENKVEENTESVTEKNHQFHVGDLAVYPAHGVGEIQAIETRVVNGEKLNSTVITHEAIVNEGRLVLEMGPKANKSWGVE